MNRIILDGKEFTSPQIFHQIIKEKLNLPDYYGNNLDALWDCLTGWIDTPVTIEWQSYEASKKSLGDYANKVLKVFKDAEEEIEDIKIIVI